MATIRNSKDILDQVKRLDKEEQFSLMLHLVELVRKADDSNIGRKLSSISGIGSTIWKDIDIDAYIEQQRNGI